MLNPNKKLVFRFKFLFLLNLFFCGNAFADLPQVCTEECRPEMMSTYSPQKQSHCKVYNIITGNEPGMASPFIFESILLTLDTAAATTCTMACIDPLNPLYTQLCAGLGITSAAIELTYSQLDKNPDISVADDIGRLLAETDSANSSSVNTLNTLHGLNDDEDQESESTNEVKDARDALSGTVVGGGAVMGGIASTFSTKTKTAQVAGEVGKSSSKAATFIKGQANAYLKGVRKTEALQQIMKNDKSITYTGKISNGMKGSSKEAVFKRNKALQHGLHCTTAAMHLALLGIRTASFGVFADIAADSCSKIKTSFNEPHRFSPIQKYAKTTQDNHHSNFLPSKYSLFNSLWSSPNFILHNIFENFAYGSETVLKLINFSSEGISNFTDSLVTTLRENSLPSHLQSEITKLEGLEGEILRNRTLTPAHFDAFPNLKISLESGLKNRSAKEIVENLVPLKDKGKIELASRIAESGQRDADALRSALNLSLPLDSLKIDSPQILSEMKTLHKERSLASASKPTPSEPLAITPSKVDSQSEPWWHEHTPLNLFEIVSHKIGNVSPRVMQY